MIRYRCSYAETEIQPGLAVFASGEVMLDSMATSPLGLEALDADFLAKGGRYFVVVARAGSIAWLVPMFSEPAWYRAHLAGKIGHPGWRLHATHFDARQAWPVPVLAVIAATNYAADRSDRFQRNRVTSAALDELRAAVRDRLVA